MDLKLKFYFTTIILINLFKNFIGSTGGSLSPVTSLALNSLTGTPLNGLQDSISNAYSSLQQYAGKLFFL